MDTYYFDYFLGNNSLYVKEILIKIFNKVITHVNYIGMNMNMNKIENGNDFMG